MALLFGLALGAQSAFAAEVSASTVQVGGANVALLTPAHPRGGIVLLAGGDGVIGVGPDGSIARQGNQLVRTREAYAARGFAVLVPDCCVDVAAAVQFMEKFGRVTLVGTSRGTQRAARGIAAGARPSRLVLTSGFLSDASGDSDNVMRIVGSPDALPPTLIVHHRHDECRKTSPDGVKPFADWAGGKARVVWLDGGTSEGDPCEAFAHHGFNGIDGQVVSVVSGFAAR
ncbi:MAG: alpha/beta hydrolase [Bradyrhizobium sp.]|nr:MAG: alpha/beta hydrolase [Bradyrhizobium sp.]